MSPDLLLGILVGAIGSAAGIGTLILIAAGHRMWSDEQAEKVRKNRIGWWER